MYFSAAIAAIAIMASSAAAQIQLDNVASFESYANTDCSPPATQNQNIPSNECRFLPGQSARVFFLEKTRANCQLRFYASNNCTGTPADTITSTPSDCLNVAQLFSYEAFCS